MAVGRYYNPATEQWEDLVAGPAGPAGPKGDKGDVGPPGATYATDITIFNAILDPDDNVVVAAGSNLVDVLQALVDENYQLRQDLNNISLLPGPSAYDVAVEEGFTGTKSEWLESLRGPQGPGFYVLADGEEFDTNLPVGIIARKPD